MNRDEFRFSVDSKSKENKIYRKNEGKIIMEAEFMLQITTFPFYLKIRRITTTTTRNGERKKKCKETRHARICSNVYNSN